MLLGDCSCDSETEARAAGRPVARTLAARKWLHHAIEVVWLNSRPFVFDAYHGVVTLAAKRNDCSLAITQRVADRIIN